MSRGAPRSIATRLRWSFLAVIVALTLVAAALTIALARRANERDAMADARTTSEAMARIVQNQITTRLEERPNQQLVVILEALQRSLSLQSAEIVRVNADGQIGLAGNQTALQRRFPVTNAPSELLSDSGLVSGESVDVADGDLVLAATPLQFTETERRRLDLGDDTVAVIAVRELGPAGLGSVGTALLFGAGIGLIVALGLAELLARRVRRPLAAVATTAQSISSGDLSARVSMPQGADAEVIEVAATVDAMADRLDRARRDRQRFLIDVSHELRTPLTSITGYAELLADAHIDDPDDIREAGSVIGREAARLKRLTDDLLTQARLDAGEMSVRTEPVDLPQMVEQVVMALRPEALRTGIEIATIGDPVIVEADPVRLQQVIGNLVENAMSFASSTVTASVDVAEGEAVLVVADDGPGIGAAAASVFDRSFTTDRPRDRQGNLGVGLSVVRGLVASMNGTIEAADGAQGARFTVRFPMPWPPPTP
jgi:signal transduction histidine kinase